MKKETLISLNAFEICETKDELVKYLINTFKDKGPLDFWHGYSCPTFILKEYNGSFFEDMIVAIHGITKDGSVRYTKQDWANYGCSCISLHELSFIQLQRLVYICNDYYLYRNYEAKRQ